MWKSHYIRFAATSIVLLAVLSGCGSSAPVQSNFSDSWGVVEVPRGGVIQVAVVVDTLSSEGQDTLRAATLAAEDYGSIYRTEVEVVQLGATCSRSNGGTMAAELLARPNIVAVVGIPCSETCLGAVPLLDANHYSVVSPSCGANELTDQITHYDNFLRTVWANTSEAQVAAEFAFFELASREAVIIRSGDVDSDDLSAVFEATFTSLGGTIAATETMTATNQASGIYSRLSDHEYDLIFAPVNSDLVAALALAADSDANSTPMIGVRNIWNDQFIEETGLTSANVYATGPTFDQSPERAGLLDKFVENFGTEPSSYTYLLSYDAMWMILDAIFRTAASDRQGTLLIGRQALNEGLYATANSNGVSGNLTCSQWGDCGSTTIGVGQVRDNQWSVIYVP